MLQPVERPSRRRWLARTAPSILACGTMLTLGNGTWAAGDEALAWGNLNATFLFAGEPPEPKQLKIDKDASLRIEPLYDRALVVDAKTKGIQDVCLWLRLEKGEQPPPVHESYTAKAKKQVRLRIANLQYESQVVVARTGQTLVVENADPIGHNSSVRLTGASAPISQVIPSGVLQEFPIRHAEAMPQPIHCTIHPWEHAWIIARDHPYVGVSDREGKLTIKNLPVGRHTFACWHAAGGFVTKVERGGKPEPWKNGRITVEIKPGDNHLGEIVFDHTRKK